MPKRPTGNPNGRPKKEISIKQFEMLCNHLWTKSEMCAFFDIDEMTMNRWCKENLGGTFSAVYIKNKEIGNGALRSAQFTVGVKKLNPSMLIWLGKQHLGQKDKHDVEIKDNTYADLLSEAETRTSDSD